jgi:transposase InsO family protein
VKKIRPILVPYYEQRAKCPDKEGILDQAEVPQRKPFVERLIGTLQKECLDYHYEPMNVNELSAVVDSRLDTYHFYRPHKSLKFLTPAEYCATLGVSIPHAASVL